MDLECLGNGPSIGLNENNNTSTMRDGIFSSPFFFIFLSLFMNVISWNSRGTSRRSFIPTIKEIYREYDCSLFFLWQLIQTSLELEPFSRTMGFDKYVAVDTRGQS